MADLNTEKLRSLNAALSTTGGDVDERFHQWLVANVSGASQDQDTPSLWKAFLVEQGYNTGDVGTDTLAYLAAKGYTGDLDTASLAAWAADDYLGAAITYLLRQTFTIGNTTVADGETISGPGGGGTYESSDGGDTGTITVKDTANGSNAISSNTLQLTSHTTGAEVANWWQSVAFTPVAGSVVQAKHRQTVQNIGGIRIDDSATSAIPALTTSTHAIQHFSGSLAGIFRVYDPPGTTAQTINTSALNYAVDTDYTDSIVFGGFTAEGVPSSSGTFGALGFRKTGAGSHVLLGAVTVPDCNNSSIYWGHTYSNATPDIHTFDDLKLPDSNTTVEAVFTPTGYFLDLFNEGSDDTAITSHTADTGESWTNDQGTWVVDSDGTAHGATLSSGRARCSSDSGLSEVFIHGRFELSGNSHYEGITYRQTDVNNGWFLQLENNTETLKLFENTAGTLTVRDSTSVTMGGTGAEPGLSVTHTANVRASGTQHEGWMDGGNKVSYSSSQHQSATRVGLWTNGTAKETYVYEIKVLPLTADTYDTELDSF